MLESFSSVLEVVMRDFLIKVKSLVFERGLIFGGLRGILPEGRESFRSGEALGDNNEGKQNEGKLIQCDHLFG